MDTEERRVLGLKCKRILDAGRRDALTDAGALAKLVYYVDPKTSLENLALIATWD